MRVSSSYTILLSIMLLASLSSSELGTVILKLSSSKSLSFSFLYQGEGPLLLRGLAEVEPGPVQETACLLLSCATSSPQAGTVLGAEASGVSRTSA